MSQSQKVLVAGTGLSGISAAKLLLDMGGEVVLYDSNPELDAEELKHEFDEDARITIVLGELKRTDLLGVEMCVISPGIPLEAPFVAVLDEAKIPIWSEIQLAYQCAKGRLAAITGTNGKTTTTALTGEIMKAYYESVFVVGNIGIPYTQVAMETEDDSVTVAEVSSFQLETIMDFRPDVSAILNITPDHLNRHHTMDNYIAAKERIAENQTKADTCVLNYDDELLRAYGENCPADVLFFSRLHKLVQGVDLEDGYLVLKDGGRKEQICHVDELHILGGHNHENAMAAIAITHRMGVPVDVIRKTLLEFRAVEHRIEFVEEIDGVAYYNDSKGTNPDAAIKGIQAMNRPTYLIGGGYDKGSEYDEWIEAFDGKVKELVLIGVTAQKIADCARKHGFEHIVFADSLEDAVKECAARAGSGDAVLLSPACASWDMFKSFEQRGELFKKYVRDLMA